MKSALVVFLFLAAFYVSVEGANTLYPGQKITSKILNKDELTILEEKCTTLRSGLVRYTDSNYLEVCSKRQWTPFNPAKRLRSGLVGHWKMDEDTGNFVDDDSGHENHATATNAAVSRGKYTRGRRINAHNGRITVPHSPALDFGKGSFSIAGWQKIENVTYPMTTFSVRKGFGCYFGPGRAGWFPGFETAHGYKATGTKVCIRDHLGNKVLVTLVHDDPYKPPNRLHKWMHYVFTFNRAPGVSRVTLYINSRKQSNTVDISSVTGSINNNKPLLFGWQYGWNTKGVLDEYRVYDYALSDDEVKLLHSDHTV